MLCWALVAALIEPVHTAGEVLAGLFPVPHGVVEADRTTLTLMSVMSIAIAGPVELRTAETTPAHDFSVVVEPATTASRAP